MLLKLMNRHTAIGKISNLIEGEFDNSKESKTSNIISEDFYSVENTTDPIFS